MITTTRTQNKRQLVYVISTGTNTKYSDFWEDTLDAGTADLFGIEGVDYDLDLLWLKPLQVDFPIPPFRISSFWNYNWILGKAIFKIKILCHNLLPINRAVLFRKILRCNRKGIGLRLNIDK
jgi:hypothetical protein